MFTLRGKVKSYKLELHGNPLADSKVYFSVVIADPGGKESKFYLLRNISDFVDRSAMGPWAVRWGQVSQAIIATIKDALLQDKEVTCVGAGDGWDGQPGFFGGSLYNWLESVEMHA